MAKYIYTINGDYVKLKEDVFEIFTQPSSVSTNGRCGPNHGKTICPGNTCCSIYGWCGGVKGQNSAWCYNNGKGDYDGYYDTTDAMIQEAARIEAARIEAERIETARKEAERIEAVREAAREAVRIEAERIEAERREAARIEAERIEAERREAARIEAERIEAERRETARKEAERREAERIEAERKKEELKKKISKNGRCGNKFNDTICPGNTCCSKYNWCGGIKGKKSDWCSVNLGKNIYGGINNGNYDGKDHLYI